MEWINLADFAIKMIIIVLTSDGGLTSGLIVVTADDAAAIARVARGSEITWNVIINIALQPVTAKVRVTYQGHN